MTLKYSILMVVLMCAGMATAVQADIYVIANASVDLNPEDIRDVFIGEKLLSTGVKLVPVDNASAQAEFLSKVMLLDLNKYNSIWTKKGFRDGLNAPDVRPSDTDVILYVKKTPGAIGYVSSLGTTTGFKTIKHY